jgi:inhibitor of KinA
MKVFNIGDSCICWQLADVISEDVSKQVITASRVVSKHLKKYILDVVPSYNALSVHFNPSVIDPDLLKHRVNAFVKSATSDTFQEGYVFELPVCYDGMDLEEVCQQKNVSVEELIELHTSKEYLVSMVGFRPHFPYLVGLDSRLKMNRRSTARMKIPAGSVAIGGEQTGVYPVEGPGGWNIIGNMVEVHTLTSVKAGDRIKFKAVEA